MNSKYGIIKGKGGKGKKLKKGTINTCTDNTNYIIEVGN
jgi:hypothetical protein